MIVLAGVCGCKKPAPEKEDEAERLRILAANPYMAEVPVPSAQPRAGGVIKHDRARAGVGLNLVQFQHAAWLLDMDGGLVHKWSNPELNGAWHIARVLPEGRLLVVVLDLAFVLLDRDGSIIWRLDGRPHHEIVEIDGGYLIFTRRPGRKTVAGQDYDVLEDFLTLVSRDGKIVRSDSLLDRFIDRIPVERWQATRGSEPTPNSPGDLLHSNTIVPLPRAIDGLGEAGDLMVSMYSLPGIAVLSAKDLSVRRFFSRDVVGDPHQPVLRSSGRFMSWDNGLRERRSTIIEVDPSTQLRYPVWPRSAETRLFMPWGGGLQVLDNGNVLATLSTDGRAIELTPEGDVVWEYLSPYFAEKRRRNMFYRMERIPLSLRP
jgi:hypothetical protein